jgi:hypothetical protein
MIKKIIFHFIFFALSVSVSTASNLTKEQDEMTEEIGRKIGILNAAYYCNYIRESAIQDYINQYINTFHDTLNASQRKSVTRIELYKLFNNISKISLRDIEDQGCDCNRVKRIYQDIK